MNQYVIMAGSEENSYTGSVRERDEEGAIRLAV